MAEHTPEAIAKWAEKQTAVSHRKPTKRLTQADVGLLIQLHKEGKSQTEIAQRLDCDQAAVSRWLSKLTDTTTIAKSYLRGSALKMAQNIIRNGLPRDHVATLKGINVLEESDSSVPKVVVQIGVKDGDVNVTLSQPTFASPDATVSEDIHRLSGDLESDNSQLC